MNRSFRRRSRIRLDASWTPAGRAAPRCPSTRSGAWCGSLVPPAAPECRIRLLERPPTKSRANDPPSVRRVQPGVRQFAPQGRHRAVVGCGSGRRACRVRGRCARSARARPLLACRRARFDPATTPACEPSGSAVRTPPVRTRWVPGEAMCARRAAGARAVRTGCAVGAPRRALGTHRGGNHGRLVRRASARTRGPHETRD